MTKPKHDWEIEDWTIIKYMVVYTWGVHVNSSYPDPVLEEGYFESFREMEDFVGEYTLANPEGKIIRIMEISRFLKVEVYEVATKVRVI